MYQRATKICSICGNNVADSKRWKDAEGRYYCDPCWVQKIADPPGSTVQTDSIVSGTSFFRRIKQKWTPKEWSDNKLVAVILLSIFGLTVIVGTLIAIISAIGAVPFLCLLLGIPIFGIWLVRRIKSDSVRSHTAVLEDTRATASVTGVPVPVEVTKECPFCGGEVQPQVRKCRHCGEWIEQTNRASEQQPSYASARVGCAVVSLVGCALVVIFIRWISAGFDEIANNKVIMKRMEGSWTAVDAARVPWTNAERVKVTTLGGDSAIHIYYPDRITHLGDLGDDTQQSELPVDKAGDTWIEGTWEDVNNVVNDKKHVRVELRSDGTLDINGDLYRRSPDGFVILEMGKPMDR